MRDAIRDAYVASATRPDEAKRRAARVAKDAVEGAADGDDGLAPKWAVFIAAAILFVVLVGITVGVAVLADAQAASVTSSQLKDLSSKLIGFDTTLAGVVFGLISGEAIGQKTS